MSFQFSGAQSWMQYSRYCATFQAGRRLLWPPQHWPCQHVSLAQTTGSLSCQAGWLCVLLWVFCCFFAEAEILPLKHLTAELRVPAGKRKSTSYYPAMNCVNILLGWKNTQMIVHPQFSLALLAVASQHGKWDTLSLEGSWASIFHTHKNVPENYSVIIYTILTELESAAKAYVPCATLSCPRMSEMFLWGLETWQRNWGETRSLVEGQWSPGRVPRFCLKSNHVLSFCQLNPIRGAHTNNTQ